MPPTARTSSGTIPLWTRQQGTTRMFSGRIIICLIVLLPVGPRPMPGSGQLDAPRFRPPCSRFGYAPCTPSFWQACSIRRPWIPEIDYPYCKTALTVETVPRQGAGLEYQKPDHDPTTDRRLFARCGPAGSPPQADNAREGMQCRYASASSLGRIIRAPPLPIPRRGLRDPAPTYLKALTPAGSLASRENSTYASSALLPVGRSRSAMSTTASWGSSPNPLTLDRRRFSAHTNPSGNMHGWPCHFRALQAKPLRLYRLAENRCRKGRRHLLLVIIWA